LIIPAACRAMTTTEYALFIDQILKEDGNLDCVPEGTFFFVFNHGANYLIWREPRYAKG
jgi:hypothetical protein